MNSTEKLPITVPKNFTASQAEEILQAADQLNQWQQQGPLLTQVSLMQLWVIYLSTPEDGRLRLHDDDDVFVHMMHVLRLVECCQAAA